MNTKHTLLISKKHKLAALELLKANGHDCELHEYGVEVEYPNMAKEILKEYNIESIIHDLR
jgi:hypothetical protein